MKLERISENQIRCTLNKTDLEEKQIMLTELAYGTEKAKLLFREMMEMASEELGFEVDEAPLMIEAIPVNPDCLILIITKVDDPDQLDTRFSRFTRPANLDEDDEEDEDDYEDEVGENPDSLRASKLMEGFEGLLQELFSKKVDEKNNEKNNEPKDRKIDMASRFAEAAGKANAQAAAKDTVTRKPASDQITQVVYVFQSLKDFIAAAKLANEVFSGDNTLYKNTVDGTYYLYMKRGKATEVEFAKVCNLISEYAVRFPSTYGTGAFFDEHYKVIRKKDAIETFAML